MIELLLILQLSILERANHIAIASSMVAHGIDISSSSWAFGKSEGLCEARVECNRFQEANWFLKWSAQDSLLFGITKMSFAVAVNYILIRLHKKYPKWTLPIAIGQTIGISYVAYRNAQLSQ